MSSGAAARVLEAHSAQAATTASAAPTRALRTARSYRGTHALPKKRCQARTFGASQTSDQSFSSRGRRRRRPRDLVEPPALWHEDAVHEELGRTCGQAARVDRVRSCERVDL